MKILRKIKHLLQRFVVCCKEYPKDRKEFGHRVARVKFWDVLIPTGKSKKYIDTLSQCMEIELKDIIIAHHTTLTKTEEKQLDKTPIWVCWWQGEVSMPDIVKLCYRAMQKQAPKGVQTVLITEENYNQFVSIPEYIVRKYRNGVISAAHFSDVLRFCLLSEYGGMWLDATVFTSGPIPEAFFAKEYYTQKVADISLYPKEPSRAQWCGFIWSGKPGNPLFCFVRDALFVYWKKHNRVMDYIFFDYIILAAYNNLPHIKAMMDRQEPNNEHIWALWQMMNREYDEDVVAELFENNIFHKLSYKVKLSARTEDGRQTVYGHILEEYKK